MAIWDARKESLQLAAGPLAAQSECVEGNLLALEALVKELEAANSPRCRLTAIYSAKAHRLGVGIYAMNLDCLGQEAGALLRPLQEVYELLEYLRLDPSRVDDIMDRGKPRAGAIAKAISGRLQSLREHLNQHASHLSFDPQSLGHLVDLETGRVRMARSPGDGAVLKSNLINLAAMLSLVLTEAMLILNDEAPGAAPELFESHERRCSIIKQSARELGIELPSDSQGPTSA